MMTSAEYAAICRRQRAAYFAWQAAPAGQAAAAIAEYKAATDALSKAQSTPVVAWAAYHVFFRIVGHEWSEPYATLSGAHRGIACWSDKSDFIDAEIRDACGRKVEG